MLKLLVLLVSSLALLAVEVELVHKAILWRSTRETHVERLIRRAEQSFFLPSCNIDVHDLELLHVIFDLLHESLPLVELIRLQESTHIRVHIAVVVRNQRHITSEIRAKLLVREDY